VDWGRVKNGLELLLHSSKRHSNSEHSSLEIFREPLSNFKDTINATKSSGPDTESRSWSLSTEFRAVQMDWMQKEEKHKTVPFEDVYSKNTECFEWVGSRAEHRTKKKIVGLWALTGSRVWLQRCDWILEMHLRHHFLWWKAGMLTHWGMVAKVVLESWLCI
jgi:hypothetical protein